MEIPGKKICDRAQSTITKDKYNIGAGLTERDQLDVRRVFSENNDRFAYSMEELSRYTGPPMEIHLNSQNDIFGPTHKLGEKEFLLENFVRSCLNLGWFGGQFNPSMPQQLLLWGRKMKVTTDFRKWGDYRRLSLETNLDRYQLPLIQSIFNATKGAKILTKLDFRSGYHQMPLRECDHAKTTFWGAQRIL